MFPAEFQTKMRALLGDAEYEAFLAAAERPRSVALRVNPAKPRVDLSSFGLQPIPWEPLGFYYDPATRPGLSPYHEAGAYYLQEASAMIPVTLLDVQPGMRVLDLCAAPGGKSTQIAAALGGKGILVCNEINSKRATILGRNIERMGVANALVLNEHPQRLQERFCGWFDRILVDAPCSGEGMFRKEEAAVTDWSQETVEMCARRQREILESAASMLRPGGRLVYSTCTFAPEENEGVISAFLKEHRDYSIAAVDAPWFSPGRPEWVADPVEGLERTFRLWPQHQRGEGHFAAVLERCGEGEASELKPEPSVQMPEELKEFCAALGAALPEGRLISFGKSLCLVPECMPLLRGLKVVRSGLELGQVLKNRLEPAHAYALWLNSCDSVAEVRADSAEAAAYLRGETIPGAQNGWTLLRVDGVSLGWVKGSGGVLKNHYPKGLRRNTI